MTTRHWPVSLFLIALFLWVTACTSYKQIEADEVVDYDKVRITRTDGERETIREPRIEADTIKGREEVAVALDEVSTVEGQYVSSLKTFGLVVFIGATVAAAIWYDDFWEWDS